MCRAIRPGVQVRIWRRPPPLPPPHLDMNHLLSILPHPKTLSPTSIPPFSHLCTAWCCSYHHRWALACLQGWQDGAGLPTGAPCLLLQTCFTAHLCWLALVQWLLHYYRIGQTLTDISEPWTFPNTLGTLGLINPPQNYLSLARDASHTRPFPLFYHFTSVL